MLLELSLTLVGHRFAGGTKLAAANRGLRVRGQVCYFHCCQIFIAVLIY